MIVFATLLMAQAAAVDMIPAERARYDRCVAAAGSGTAEAVRQANAWLVEGGGIPARHCLGLALLATGKPEAASQTFEAAARAAERRRWTSRIRGLGQAGNAAILAEAWPRAETLLNSAIVAAAGRAELRGNLLIDRARVRVELANLAGARADLGEATRLLPENPLGWLLSASLARRQGRLPDARTAIDKAAALAPENPDVEVEQGNIAALEGNDDEARRLWSAAAKAAPDSPAGKAAADALIRNPGNQ